MTEEQHRIFNQLGSPDFSLRQQAQQHLGKNLPENDIILSNALSATRPIVRWEAVKYLAESPLHTNLPLLCRALSDEIDSIRWMAANGITRLGKQAVLEALDYSTRSDDFNKMAMQLAHMIQNFPGLVAIDLLQKSLSAIHNRELASAKIMVKNFLREIREKPFAESKA